MSEGIVRVPVALYRRLTLVAYAENVSIDTVACRMLEDCCDRADDAIWTAERRRRVLAGRRASVPAGETYR